MKREWPAFVTSEEKGLAGGEKCGAAPTTAAILARRSPTPAEFDDSEFWRIQLRRK
jgi:hypothetical protein